MIMAIDFDGSIVREDRAYNDLTSPLKFVRGAGDALYALKSAGHVLLLWSARANRALRENPYLDPLVRGGVRGVNAREWMAAQPLHEARYQEMIQFVKKELPGVFDAIDDGVQGKPDVDLFIDDKMLARIDWPAIRSTYANASAIEEQQRIEWAAT